MKFRTGLVVAAVAGATLAGGAIAQATPAQDRGVDTTPDWTAICESHHPDWSATDWQEMDRFMEEHGFGSMDEFMDERGVDGMFGFMHGQGFEGMDEYMHGQGFEGMDEYMHGQGFEGLDEYMHGQGSGHMGSMMGGGAGWGA